MAKRGVSKKSLKINFTKNDIYDLILNLIILGILIAIIVLLVKCQKKQNEMFSVQGFNPQDKEWGSSNIKENKKWRNQRFCNNSPNDVLDKPNPMWYNNPIPTNPIHEGCKEDIVD